jgi:hypothetical protein
MEVVTVGVRRRKVEEQSVMVAIILDLVTLWGGGERKVLSFARTMKLVMIAGIKVLGGKGAATESLKIARIMDLVTLAKEMSL